MWGVYSLLWGSVAMWKTKLGPYDFRDAENTDGIQS